MLRESVDNQAGIEAIARAVMSALSLNCAQRANEFIKNGGNPEAFDIAKVPAIDLRTALRYNKVSLSDDVQNFVNSHKSLKFEIELDTATRKAGSYSSKKLSWWDDDSGVEYVIELVFDWHQMSLRSMLKYNHEDIKYSAMEFSEYLKTRYTTLVHELIHAFDEWRSGGKHANNKASLKAKDSRKSPPSTMSTKYPAYSQRQIDYLNNPIEINARYYQTIADIADVVDVGFNRSWSRLVEEFEQRIRGWNIMPSTTKIRLLKRLAIEYSHRRAAKIGEVDKNVSNWTKRVRATEGVVFTSRYNSDTDIVSLNLASIRDVKKKEAVLESWALFGSIFRKTIATNDLTPKEAALTGFVKNSGKKADTRVSMMWLRAPRLS